MPYHRLIHKVSSYGIRGRILKWLKAFLINRCQRVIPNVWLPIRIVFADTRGPPGIILGPVLFLLYVNNLPDVVGSTSKVFTDDCKVYRTIRNCDYCALLQNDLDALKLAAGSWDWFLNFSNEKCLALCIRMPYNYPYSIEVTIISMSRTRRT